MELVNGLLPVHRGGAGGAIEPIEIRERGWFWRAYLALCSPAVPTTGEKPRDGAELRRASGALTPHEGVCQAPFTRTFYVEQPPAVNRVPERDYSGDPTLERGGAAQPQPCDRCGKQGHSQSDCKVRRSPSSPPSLGVSQPSEHPT